MIQQFLLFALITLFSTTDALADRKDFKGLFGSYRRELFVENEAKSTAFGIDLALSTLLPLSPVVKSIDSGSTEPLHYSAFFNYELSFFMSYLYHWEIFLSIGYYQFDTRKQNKNTIGTATPQFHAFEMTLLPILFGVKYRLSTDDMVPYFGGGAGFSYTRRKGSYDYSPTTVDEQYLNTLTAEFIAGLEFYFSSKAGIRLEASLYYLKLPERTFQLPQSSSIIPLIYQPNPWSIRYSSGIFYLF